jgi:hemolysin III
VTSAVAIPEHTQPKPRLRGRLHQVAVFVTVPAGLVLLVAAPSTAARISALIYLVTLLAQFGVSAAYHRRSWEPRGHVWMKRLDHSTIFLLIAGTYTPICVMVLDGLTQWVILAVVWVGAAVGIATKFYRVDLHVLQGILYIGLGWAAVVILPAMWRGLTTPAFVLVVVGGVLYTLGALVLALNRPDPFPKTFGYHEVWHSATIGAAGCMYAAILLVFLAV